MTLGDLIIRTREEAASAEPLDLLASAAQQQQLLSDIGDELLDHFVHEAREAGFSWSQIGATLGVSKQAVQQRHTPAQSLLGKLRSAVSGVAGGMFTRFTSVARQAVILAQDEARRLQHPKIDTEHLLLGLIGVPDGRGAQLLTEAGLDLGELRAEIEAAAGSGPSPVSGRVPFTPAAKKAVELSLRHALHLKDDHIGTEHLLLGLLTDRAGIGGEVLTRHDITVQSIRVALGHA
ncbi:MAG: ATP-dependent Clp protease ATP-binding subunit [Actinobacteria bacterium]|nr:ATP-dependent Clp protease ATP-binding subunit [Actinomycetota bacterium]